MESIALLLGAGAEIPKSVSLVRYGYQRMSASMTRPNSMHGSQNGRCGHNQLFNYISFAHQSARALNL